MGNTWGRIAINYYCFLPGDPGKCLGYIFLPFNHVNVLPVVGECGEKLIEKLHSSYSLSISK